MQCPTRGGRMNRKEMLRKLMSSFADSKRVLIVINADPDSIASAMAMRRLLWNKVAEVTITHFNDIHRPDNLAMIKYTESNIVHIKNIKNIKKKEYDTFVIVDSQPDHNPCFYMFNFDIVLDHHPVGISTNATFVDIRPDYGSCSTLMVEYLRAAKVQPSSKLASALLLGLKTDTGNLTRNTTLEDFKTYQYLFFPTY